jgi:serine/threonine protein kinase
VRGTARYADEVAGILGQTAKALEKAHAQEVAHRDLKLVKIFVHIRDDGRSVAKVLDFGVAKIKEDIRRSNPSAKRHISAENIIGTVH